MKNRTKSRKVSQAIIWFYTKGRMMDTEITVEQHASLLERFNEKCIQVMELEKELEQIARPGQVADDEANHVSPGGGIWAILARIWPFY